VRQYSGVPMQYEMITNELVSEVPEFEPSVREHVQTHDDLLPHVLFGDFTRFVIEAWRNGDRALLRRCLDFLERALVEGDERVKNLIIASFIENVGVWEPTMVPFVEMWPDALRAQAGRQSGSG
jgi:hypothetical protein